MPAARECNGCRYAGGYIPCLQSDWPAAQQDDAERDAEESDEASRDDSEESDESAQSREQRASQQQPRALDPFNQWSEPVEDSLPVESDIFRRYGERGER